MSFDLFSRVRLTALEELFNASLLRSQLSLALRGFRLSANGLCTLPLEAFRFCPQLSLALLGFSLSPNGFGPIPFEAFGLRSQLGERARDEGMGRTELFQARDRRLPASCREFAAGVLHGGARKALVGNR